MPSGGKALVFNTLERAVSTDFNRLQAFSNADRAEVYRWKMNVLLGSADFGVTLAGNADVQNTTLTSPMSGEVVGGGLVRPQLGTSGNPLSLLVDPVVAWVIDPDTDADASNYKLVRDPGISTLPGSLLMTANSSGSVRVDVVECQYSLNSNAETDNRDIFNPATGAFTATTVSKATQAGFTYRVRLGTPGSGFPGTASGWMPLCVACVPTGTTTNDTITFYDVRPLVADRSVAPFNYPNTLPQVTRAMLNVDSGGATNAFLSGAVETNGVFDPASSAPFPWRLGGQAGSSSATGPDLSTAAFQSGTLTNGLAYLYLLMPFGLPRWVRYSAPAAGSRVPSGVKGIVVVSNTGPGGPLNPAPSSAINLPVSLFGTGSTQCGACVAPLEVASSNVQTLSSGGEFNYCGNGYSAASATTISSPQAVFTMTPNGTTANLGYAASAKALDMIFTFTLQIASATTGFMTDVAILLENNAATQIYANIDLGSVTCDNRSGGNLNYTFSFRSKVPVPVGVGVSTWKILVSPGASAGTLTAASARIVGIAL